MMTGMTPEEAAHFYEEDEDPQRVFAAFDAAEKGVTAPGVALSADAPYVMAAPVSLAARLRVRFDAPPLMSAQATAVRV